MTTATRTDAEAHVLPVTDPRWSRFLAGRPEATPFHQPAWSQVIAECYGYRPFAVLARTADGEVGVPVIAVRHAAGRPRWVSLPYTDHCAPLGAAGPEVTSMLDELRGAAGVARWELRGALPGGAVHDGGTSLGHTIALGPDPDAVFATLHRSQVQRNIRRAQRERVVVRRSAERDDLTRVFHALHVGTRRRLGVPVQPLRYFQVLWRRMIRAGLGFTSVASIDGTPIAAAVFLVANGTVVYKYGASDPARWDARANHLLFWDAIRWACEHGAHTFDFGRTGTGDASLREFKSRWGTAERALPVSVLADRAPRPSRDEVPERVREVIRRSPPVVTRALGRALYRFTA